MRGGQCPPVGSCGKWETMGRKSCIRLLFAHHSEKTTAKSSREKKLNPGEKKQRSNLRGSLPRITNEGLLRRRKITASHQNVQNTSFRRDGPKPNSSFYDR